MLSMQPNHHYFYYSTFSLELIFDFIQSFETAVDIANDFNIFDLNNAVSKHCWIITAIDFSLNLRDHLIIENTPFSKNSVDSEHADQSMKLAEQSCNNVLVWRQSVTLY